MQASSFFFRLPLPLLSLIHVFLSRVGKTALAEWMLYDEHMLCKEPRSGAALSLDSDPVESSRHSSVFSHFLRVPHGVGGSYEHPYLLQVTDTPWGDFPSDAVAALNGADGAVVVVSAADGVQAGTIHALEHCQQAGIPAMICLSKMDRPYIKVDSVLQELKSTLNGKIQFVPLQVAVMGENEDSFQGVVPLLVLGDSGEVQRNPNVKLDEGLHEAWMVLEEAVAMTEDDLLVDYLENGKLETQQVLDGLHAAVRRQQEQGVSSSTTILPLVYTAAEQNLGVVELMDAMVAVLPNPVEMREKALQVSCQNQGICDRLPGVEAGFAARVLHTTIDSFGSLSVLRIISNSQTPGATASFDSLPPEAIILRTGENIRLPSISTSVGLCGKERLPLTDNSPVMPGDVIALPKLSESVQTNDILTAPNAVQEEEEEIVMETESHNLTPLSRPPEHVPLMTCATISLSDSAGNGKKSRSSGGGAGGDDKLISALTALARQDLAVRIEHDVSGKLLLRCMSTDHQKVLVQRLQDRYGLQVELGKPSVQYRETLAKAVRNIEGRHKKQSGGSGQFGVCYITMEPLEEGAGIEFESQVKGGAINKAFISSVEKGVREQLQLGGPLGYPVTGVKIIVTDGKMHSVDSKDVAFQSAGKLAVKAALEKGGTRLLQPMEKVVFAIEEKLQGDINTIVTRGSGYVTSTNPSSSVNDSGGAGTRLEVEAIIPTATIGDVSDVLRAASGGEAQYTSEFSHYSVVPESDVDAILTGRDDDDTRLYP
jgi:elongation factor G